jgi:hypothetical protein
VPPADLQAQLTLALQVRDDISRLTDMVELIRSVRTQLQARVETLKNDPKAADLVKNAKALMAKLDGLEGRLHNPTAEVSYDILAMRGGTRLYSRLAPLLDWVSAGSGAPTAAIRQVFAAQDKELAGFGGEWDNLLSVDLGAINKEAARLGIGFVIPRTGGGQ